MLWHLPAEAIPVLFESQKVIKEVKVTVYNSPNFTALSTD